MGTAGVPTRDGGHVFASPGKMPIQATNEFLLQRARIAIRVSRRIAPRMIHVEFPAPPQGELVS
jgi:hypothetical protein